MLAQEKLQEKAEEKITPLTRQQLAELMPSAQGLLSDEPEMEHSLHALQLLILVSCLARLWQDRNDYFLAWNLTVYYSREQLKNKDFRGPDLFLVKGVENRPRPSWVVWEEGGKYPDLIIELLSESTAKVDRGEKRELYERIFRTPEYFYYSPETQEFMGLRLRGRSTRRLSQRSRAGAGARCWSCIWGSITNNCATFSPMGSWCLLLKKLRESSANVLSKSDSEQSAWPRSCGSWGWIPIPCKGKERRTGND